MPETITFEGRSVYAVCPEEYDEMVAELERLRAAQPAAPDDLRADGLTVAVHNDYRINGESHTFWLFVGPDGMSYKGEGRTDSDALNQVRALLASKPAAAQPAVPTYAGPCMCARDYCQNRDGAIKHPSWKCRKDAAPTAQGTIRGQQTTVLPLANA